MSQGVYLDLVSVVMSSQGHDKCLQGVAKNTYTGSRIACRIAYPSEAAVPDSGVVSSILRLVGLLGSLGFSVSLTTKHKGVVLNSGLQKSSQAIRCPNLYFKWYVHITMMMLEWLLVLNNPHRCCYHFARPFHLQK